MLLETLMNYKILSAPEEKAVNLPLLRKTAKLVDEDAEAEDILIASVKAATIYLEKILGRCAVNTQIEDSYNGTPGEEESIYIRTIRAPLVSVEKIVYVTIDNVEHIFPSQSYYVCAGEAARIALNFGYMWPVNLRDLDSFRVQYTAGYGLNWKSVPMDFQNVISQLAIYWFRNPDALVSGEIPLDMSDSFKQKLAPLNRNLAWY